MPRTMQWVLHHPGLQECGGGHIVLRHCVAFICKLGLWRIFHRSAERRWRFYANVLQHPRGLEYFYFSLFLLGFCLSCYFINFFFFFYLFMYFTFCFL